jgi:hypothetical protein
MLSTRSAALRLSRSRSVLLSESLNLERALTGVCVFSERVMELYAMDRDEYFDNQLIEYCSAALLFFLVIIL